MKRFKTLRNVALEDDGVSWGGVAFRGETVGDFLDSVDPYGNQIITIQELNKTLESCGIKTIDFWFKGDEEC